MVLTFAEDFTTSANLDTQLKGVSPSGVYWNRGVHPSVNVENLLSFLPDTTITFLDYSAGSSYSKFETSRNPKDVVLYNGVIYQSLTNDNIGNTPGSSPANWLETNLNSLRIKAFIFSVEDSVLTALNLNRKLLESQYIYNVSRNVSAFTPSGNYIGWLFEPKGSDYVTVRINQIAFQANTDTPQNLYVINQGVLVDTLTLNPQNGLLEFEEVGYTFKGKGAFLFVTEAQEVLSEQLYNDPLKYRGFVCAPVSGVGLTPQGSSYEYTSSANGLNFNVSAYLDSTTYIDNNKIDLAALYQSQFEYDFLRLMLYGSHNRFNLVERIQKANPELLAAEVIDLKAGTVARRYNEQKKQAIEAINSTFDAFLKKKTGLNIKRKTF